MYRRLHDGWTLDFNDGIPATVPGCVHTDLLAAGLIEEPYRDDNETRLAWIGRRRWTYTTTFDWAPDGHDRVDLVCEGLDTVATLRLNGVEIGHTANMHRTYRFPVSLNAGSNTLSITFDSAYDYALAHRERLGDRPGAYDEPYQFIRKMACNFGWDWGPTLVTAGIWRAIGLHSWSGARLASVRPQTRLDGVDVFVDVERVSEDPLTVTASIGGVMVDTKLAAGQTSAVLKLDVPDAQLWWPQGHGEQHLYDLSVTLGESTWSRRVGLRTVSIEREAFRLIVNGKPVFVRGFNWIPDDCFPTRVTADHVATRMRQAIDAGANLLRVWGGGVYESDEFYNTADELGLLVWQDFPFACAAYPEEEPFASEVEAEARDNIVRLMSHPSLVIWCGNNENLEGHQHWGWRDRLEGRSWGAGFYHDLLPRLVGELDPSRPYWPGSPYSGDPSLDVKDPSLGTVHIWTVWVTHDYTHYATYTPRFVAEFGFQGPPTWATLRDSVTAPELTPDSSHQKAIDGQAKLLSGLQGHLPRPSTFDDWHYYTQLNQARAVSFGIQRFRALMPYCMGTIVWQLNDCWPVTSWAAVDGAGRRKPLWYELRRAYADRLITFQDNELVLVNDSALPWRDTLVTTQHTIHGEVLTTQEVPISIPPRDVARFPYTPADLVTASVGAQRAVRFAEEDVSIAFPPASLRGTAEPVDGGYRVHITAETILRELALFPDRLDPDATIDDQLVTLLPGESVTWHITTTKQLDPTQLLTHPVLRCLNEPSSPWRRS
ncbi:glycoside hydrolase family 2 protein [Allorhizocola rhizosphaerae]|uniref:glycoside hydrolase family 2 protein n=1 Tax=Allorhizocola rhizosphaerae TaxID=1872709 RepID=UPI000E3D6916|nr:glycoside hydrolase family 2 protein [Allorhizocola rhizosphaerae]